MATENLKILLASDVYPPYVSGVSTYTQDIERALRKLGFSVKVVVPKYKPLISNNLITVPSINVPFYPALKTGMPYSFILQQKIKAFNPDIIHLQTQGLIGLQVADIGRRLKKPTVATFHTYFLYENNFREIGLEFFYPIFNKIAWRYNKWFFNRLTGLISPSKSLIDYLKKFGITTPLTYIPNPINPKEIVKTRINLELVRKKFHLGSRNILYTGRISGEKNLENLILAFQKVQEILPETKLILVGGGPAFKCLKKLTAALHLSASVIFIGTLERKKLLSSGIYSAVQFFATASESENQPLSVIEAMALGLPIVGVNAMGLSELVTNNGLLSKPGNIESLATNMLTLLQDDRLRKKMGENSKKNAQRYDIKTVIKRLVNYYQSFR